MTIEQNKLIAFIGKTLRAKPSAITLQTRRGELPHWDSLGHVILVEAICQEYKLTLSADDALAMDSIEDVCRIVNKRILAQTTDKQIQ